MHIDTYSRYKNQETMCSTTQDATVENPTRRRRLRRATAVMLSSKRRPLVPFVASLIILIIQAPFPLSSSLSPRKFVKRVSNKATNFISNKRVPKISNLSLPLPNKRSIRIVSNDDNVNGHGVNGDGGNTISLLKTENVLLRDTVRQLEVENEILKQNSNKLVLETFEGEGRKRERESSGTSTLTSTTPVVSSATSKLVSASPAFVNGTSFDTVESITMSGAELEQDANMW